MNGFKNEPVTSFANKKNRQDFADALATVRHNAGREYGLVIGGDEISTGNWIESHNPSQPEEIIGRAACASTADADLAVATANKSLPSWRAVNMADRADYLIKAAGELRRGRFELAALVTLESGKPWREADADIAEAIDYLEYYAAAANRLALNPRRRDLPGEDNVLVLEPKGVCAVLAPWCFPLALLTNMTAAALVTGNTVIMKPASATPIIAAKLMEVFEKVKLPPGVLAYLPGHGETVGKHLVEHPNVNVIAFTGSRDVGTEIMQCAFETPPGQQHIKKVISELGGKNAIIVDDDADLGEAVSGVITSAFGYSGQKCTSCSRVVVLESVYNTFCEKLGEAASQLTIGPADLPGTFVGPLIDEESRDRVKAFVDAAGTECRILLESNTSAIPGGGAFWGPTIIADVNPNSTIAQEEILGPVLSVIKARDFEEALDIANGTRYALTGGVYSRSPANIEKAKRHYLVGNLYINRKITGSRVDIEPFGGLKMSGDGAKAGGPDFLHHFCNARTITEHTLRHGLAPAQEIQTKV